MTLIGSSDLDVLPIALGANTFGWTADRDVSFAILDAFTAAGGSLVDTADVYSAWAPGNSGGESETIIGEWIAARGGRDRLVISTKVGSHPDFAGLRADNIAAAAEQSLRRLQTDYIDLYFAHKDDPETPLEETVGALAQLQHQGVVRHVAISNYSADRISEWLEIAERLGVPAPVALQPHYNLLNREPFESEIAPLAEEHELGVTPYYGLAAGFLTGKYRSATDAEGVARSGMVSRYLNDAGFAAAQAVVEIAAERDVSPAAVALAWLRDRPTVAAPIAGATSVEQVAPLIEAATLELEDGERNRLDAASDAFAAA